MKFKKLTSRKGETLVEILVAILIIALAAGLFASMYMAAMSINSSARKQDEQFFDAVEKLEQAVDENKTKSDKTVTYTPVGEGAGASSSAQVEVVTEDGMSVYRD